MSKKSDPKWVTRHQITRSLSGENKTLRAEMSLLLDWKYKSNCQSPGKVFRVEELLSSGNSRGMKLMTTRDRWRWRWRWRYRSRCRWRRRMAGQVSVWKFPPNCIYCWLQLKGFLLPWLQCNYDKLGNSF